MVMRQPGADRSMRSAATRSPERVDSTVLTTGLSRLSGDCSVTTAKRPLLNNTSDPGG